MKYSANSTSKNFYHQTVSAKYSNELFILFIGLFFNRLSLIVAMMVVIIIFGILLELLFRSIPWEVFLWKGILKISTKFIGEHSCRSVISIKSQSNVIEITLQHGCSPVNLLHIFRTLFPKNTAGWLRRCFRLLWVVQSVVVIIRRIQNLFQHLRWIYLQKLLVAESHQLSLQKTSS